MPDDKPLPASTAKLVSELVIAGAPEHLLANARNGIYHDFNSPLPCGITQLVADLDAAGLTALARRARDGEYDATRAESDAWAASPDGQATFRKLLPPPKPPVHPHHEAAGKLWVYPDLTPSGDYALAIQYSEDGMFYPRDPVAYALAVVEAALRAAYDAGVMGQTRFIGGGSLTDTDIYHSTIGPLRADRPPPDGAATEPLVFSPIMAARNSQPYVHVRTTSGRDVTQMTFADAIGHAMYVLTAAAATGLDNAYRRHLLGSLGLQPGQAAEVIGDLARFMPDFAVAGTQDEDDLKVPPAPAAPEREDPLAECSCNHLRGDHTGKGGRCAGRDSYGVKCQCPSYEPSQNQLEEP